MVQHSLPGPISNRPVFRILTVHYSVSNQYLGSLAISYPFKGEPEDARLVREIDNAAYNAAYRKILEDGDRDGTYARSFSEFFRPEAEPGSMPIDGYRFDRRESLNRAQSIRSNICRFGASNYPQLCAQVSMVSDDDAFIDECLLDSVEMGQVFASLFVESDPILAYPSKVPSLNTAIYCKELDFWNQSFRRAENLNKAVDAIRVERRLQTGVRNYTTTDEIDDGYVRMSNVYFAPKGAAYAIDAWRRDTARRWIPFAQTAQRQANSTLKEAYGFKRIAAIAEAVGLGSYSGHVQLLGFEAAATEAETAWRGRPFLEPDVIRFVDALPVWTVADLLDP